MELRFGAHGSAIGIDGAVGNLAAGCEETIPNWFWQVDYTQEVDFAPGSADVCKGAVEIPDGADALQAAKVDERNEVFFVGPLSQSSTTKSVLLTY